MIECSGVGGTILILGRSRDRFYLFRRDIRFLINRKRVNRQHLNLDTYRVNADYVLTQVEGLSIKKNRFEDEHLSVDTIMSELCNQENLVVYLRLDTANQVQRTLDIIFNEFTGTFVIDPRDLELRVKPEWIGPNAAWASPHIPNPFESSGLCIPVGVEELFQNRNGKLSQLNFQPNKNRFVLVGPFASSHQRRSEFAGWVGNSLIHVEYSRLKPKAYARLVSDYKFIVCPRGNGIDTVRFWETLYRGSIPIVESSDWARYFQSHGIPMLLVDNFKELLSWSQSDFSAIWDQLFKTPSDIEALWPEYWLKRIRNLKQ